MSELYVYKGVVGVVVPLSVVGAVLTEDRALDDVVDALSAFLFLRPAFLRPILILSE
jgi:hypothetical protein